MVEVPIEGGAETGGRTDYAPLGLLYYCPYHSYNASMEPRSDM